MKEYDGKLVRITDTEDVSYEGNTARCQSVLKCFLCKSAVFAKGVGFHGFRALSIPLFEPKRNICSINNRSVKGVFLLFVLTFSGEMIKYR